MAPPESLGSRIKKALGPIGVIGVVILKFIAKIKFILPILLKTGGSMVLMVGVYASIWGWKWALGFVLLLLLHECGHLIVAKWFGLAVSAPMFIPFMGAFIALKEAPRNAWMEACVGIGGPILGSLAAAACHALGLALNYPLLIALGWSAYFLNLFNLTPVGMLDGGRIVSALSPWLWLPGFAALGWLAWTHPNFIVWILLFASLPRIVSLFRKRTEEEQRYYEVAPAQRWLMALMYFGLIGALVLGMHVSHLQLMDRVGAARQKYEQTFPQAE
ncbi:MAG: site-2 protease family protein [Verrucomicrobia bacterium]|nr:MAG: site-2 protease family protein [Verrucomicrobiota bacterium]